MIPINFTLVNWFASDFPITSTLSQLHSLASVFLTHCGLAMQYGKIDLGQLWLKQYLAASLACWYEAITWTNVELSSWAISQVFITLILNMCFIYFTLKIIVTLNVSVAASLHSTSSLRKPDKTFNSLAPGGFGCNFKNSIFKLVLLIGTFRASFDKNLRWMVQDLTDDKSTLVQHWWRHQAITWANVDPDLCCCMASLSHNELIKQAFWNDAGYCQGGMINWIYMYKPFVLARLLIHIHIAWNSVVFYASYLKGCHCQTKWCNMHKT